MYERKERNKNSYYPAFFCMDLDIPDAIGNMLRMPMDERTEALFLHEYIHYLQDITTVSGYARIERIMENKTSRVFRPYRLTGSDSSMTVMAPVRRQTSTPRTSRWMSSQRSARPSGMWT